MEPGSIAQWAGVAIAAASAVVSVFAWWRSRAARDEAAEQARIATQARLDTAADVKRTANLTEAQHHSHAETVAAEIEPWDIDPVPGYTW
jgi:type II secretory pathway pseudopilin PulG